MLHCRVCKVEELVLRPELKTQPDYTLWSIVDGLCPACRMKLDYSSEEEIVHGLEIQDYYVGRDSRLNSNCRRCYQGRYLKAAMVSDIEKVYCPVCGHTVGCWPHEDQEEV